MGIPSSPLHPRFVVRIKITLVQSTGCCFLSLKEARSIIPMSTSKISLLLSLSISSMRTMAVGFSRNLLARLASLKPTNFGGAPVSSVFSVISLQSYIMSVSGLPLFKYSFKSMASSVFPVPVVPAKIAENMGFFLFCVCSFERRTAPTTASITCSCPLWFFLRKDRIFSA